MASHAHPYRVTQPPGSQYPADDQKRLGRNPWEATGVNCFSYIFGRGIVPILSCQFALDAPKRIADIDSGAENENKGCIGHMDDKGNEETRRFPKLDKASNTTSRIDMGTLW